MNWLKSLKGKVRVNEPLKGHTTFKIGGPAKFFIQPKDIADLRLLLKAAKKERIPFLVIGAGSNILAGDKGTKAIVAHLGSSAFRKLSLKTDTLKAGSGLKLSELIERVRQHNLSGLEFLGGIPGTVGGALAMNAGSTGKSIGDLVKEVQVMDYSGRIKTFPKEKIKFGYRRSSLAKFIILNVVLKVNKGKPKEIQDKINKLLAYRRQTQDYSLPNAGCVFKNPQGGSAGKLIDLCGLKGKSYGGAVISKKHANFILNKSGATCSDVLGLMRIAQAAVKKRFRIKLEPEIKIWQ